MKGFYREDIGKTEDKGKVKATSTKKKRSWQCHRERRGPRARFIYMMRQLILGGENVLLI